MKLTCGFDDEEHGTATLTPEGDVRVDGDEPELVKKLLATWPDLRGKELLQRVEAACNGRAWAVLDDGGNAEMPDTEPSTNSNPEGYNQYTGSGGSAYTHEHLTAELRKAGISPTDAPATWSNSDPLGIAKIKVPPQVEAKLGQAVKDAVQAHDNPFMRLTIPQLHERLAKDVPVRQFQAVLARMHQHGEVQLGPYTQALSTHDSPQHLLPMDREYKHFVGKARTDNTRNLEDILTDNDEPAANGWVTLDGGQAVFIGEGGALKPGGPKGKVVDSKQDQSAGKPNPFASGGKKKLTPSPSPPPAPKTTPTTVKEGTVKTAEEAADRLRKAGRTADEDQAKNPFASGKWKGNVSEATLAKIKGGKNAVTLQTKDGKQHRIRNLDDLKEFVKAGGDPHSAPVAEHAPSGKPQGVPPTAKYVGPSQQEIQAAPKDVRGFYSAAKAALHGAGKAIYDQLPKPAQKLVDGALWIDKHGERFYKGIQHIATGVAKERGLDAQDTQRLMTCLKSADMAARYTQWVGAESIATAIGGPVGLAAAGGAAKVSFYMPTASLMYIGGAMLGHALEGRNPMELIKNARHRVAYAKQQVRDRKNKQTTNASRTAYVDLHSWADAVAEWLQSVGPDHQDEAAALLAAALDEERGDKTAALELAKASAGYQDDEPAAESEDA